MNIELRLADIKPITRIVAREIAAASRALEFAESREREAHSTANAIRLQYCEAWLKSLQTIARALP